MKPSRGPYGGSRACEAGPAEAIPMKAQRVGDTCAEGHTPRKQRKKLTRAGMGGDQQVGD